MAWRNTWLQIRRNKSPRYDATLPIRVPEGRYITYSLSIERNPLRGLMEMGTGLALATERYPLRGFGRAGKPDLLHVGGKASQLCQCDKHRHLPSQSSHWSG